MSDNPFDASDASILEVASKAEGPSGSLPFTPEMLLTRPSGDLFGWSQNAGMGWNPATLGGREFLILSTHGGVRAPDGTPIALGYHTGHWEVGLLVEEAAKALKGAGAIPFAAACTDPCDGRSQGTAAMFDSLPFRNDAAMIFGRLIRSLPTGRGVLGIATCDKGLPAMMMALAAARDLATVLVPDRATTTRVVRSRLPHLCVAGRRLPVPRHRGDVAGGRRSAGAVARAHRAGAVGSADLARHGAPLGARVESNGTARRHDA